MSGGDLVLVGGFRFALAPGDCDSDGCIGLHDYADMTGCLAGPDGRLSSPECACFDSDDDNDVDLADVAVFQRKFHGP